MGRRSQVVRQWFAKPSFTSSTLVAASSFPSVLFQYFPLSFVQSQLLHAHFLAPGAGLEVGCFLRSLAKKRRDRDGTVVIVESDLNHKGGVDQFVDAGEHVFHIAVDPHLHGRGSGMDHAAAQNQHGAGTDRFAEAQVVDGGGGYLGAAVAGGDHAGDDVYPHGELAAKEVAVAVQMLRHDDVDLLRERFAYAFSSRDGGVWHDIFPPFRIG